MYRLLNIYKTQSQQNVNNTIDYSFKQSEKLTVIATTCAKRDAYDQYINIVILINC